MRIRVRDAITLALVGWWVGGVSTISSAQEAKSAAPTVLTIRPTRAPVPALKYRLFPERRDQSPGNAAIFYHRACLMMLSSARNNAVEEKLNKWLSGPTSDIDQTQARSYLQAHANVLHEAELGAFRRDCDWEFDAREEGFSLLLPEIQEIRRVGRLIALKSRIEVLDGHFDEALHWIEIGFSMSRHIGETPFLIASLVGISITSQLKQPLEDLIQAQGSPNLYWAFAASSRPIINMPRAIEGERHILERELPELAKVDGTAWSTEKARIFADELFEKMKSLTNTFSSIDTSGTKRSSGTPRLADFSSRLAIAALAARIYPEAKRALIAEGRPEAIVEAMPVIQVVTLHTLRQYQSIRDNVFKWTYFPYAQAHQRMTEAWRGHREVSNKLANPLLAMFLSVMPAIESALLANARNDRQFNALQCVEAIRAYAAEHDGELPANLDAMTNTPLPADPMIGGPFTYTRVDATTATLTAPAPVGGPKIPQYMINYQLNLVK